MKGRISAEMRIKVWGVFVLLQSVASLTGCVLCHVYNVGIAILLMVVMCVSLVWVSQSAKTPRQVGTGGHARPYTEGN